MGSNGDRSALIAALAVVIGVVATVLVGALLVAVDQLQLGSEDAPRAPVSVSENVDRADAEIDFGILDEIFAILEEDFVEPDRVDRELLFEGAIQGIFDALGDPHSVYLDPESYLLSQTDIEGSFEGIGASIDRIAGSEFVVIIAPFSGSPAERAGIASGDLIVEIDGESARGISTREAVLKIRGPGGTAVELLVRHLNGEEERITIVRENIVISSVITVPRGGVLLDAAGGEATDIGYIRIEQFGPRTPEDLEAAVLEAEARGVSGLIIDVRSNPGGLLIETAMVADMFLDEGLIVIQVTRDGTEFVCDVCRARPGTVTDLPIVILQDQFSASGSELLAAALQENGRATVVGTRSFGKGTVNHARDLSNGGAVYVSIARWLTPTRNLIEGDGVAPDIEIQLTLEDIEAGRDIAVFRAIDVLRGEGLATGAETEPAAAAR